MSIITETKTIKVKEGCGDNPVYLCWLNDFGGFEYWLFTKFQNERIQTRIKNSFEINITDFETSIGNIDISGKRVKNTIEVQSVFELDDLSGIKSLIQSTSVSMLSNPDSWTIDGAIWKKVIVKDSSFLIFKTNKSLYDIKLILELPDIYTQQQ